MSSLQPATVVYEIRVKGRGLVRTTQLADAPFAQESPQQQYDIMYGQCMAAHGNSVASFSPPPGTTPIPVSYRKSQSRNSPGPPERQDLRPARSTTRVGTRNASMKAPSGSGRLAARFQRPVPIIFGILFATNARQCRRNHWPARTATGCQMDQNRVKTQFGFRRAHQIAGIMIPTTNIMTKNSAIFQPHVTGAIAAIAIPNPTMQARTMASFPPLIRASSFSRRSALWRVCNGGLFSVNGAPKGTEWQESLVATLPRIGMPRSRALRIIWKEVSSCARKRSRTRLAKPRRARRRSTARSGRAQSGSRPWL
jgi:hypothetical protein